MGRQCSRRRQSLIMNLPLQPCFLPELGLIGDLYSDQGHFPGLQRTQSSLICSLDAINIHKKVISWVHERLITQHSTGGVAERHDPDLSERSRLRVLLADAKCNHSRKWWCWNRKIDWLTLLCSSLHWWLSAPFIPGAKKHQRQRASHFKLHFSYLVAEMWSVGGDTEMPAIK